VPRAVTASPSDAPRPISGQGVLRLSFTSGDRLHTAAEFAAVFSHRRVLRGDRFDLHYRPGGAGQASRGARLGLVIARKQARRAVVRNLLKRLAREAFRQRRSRLPAFDLVLRLAKPVVSVDRASRLALRAEIDDLLQRLSERVAQ